MSDSGGNLVLFTNTYPYGKGEAFLEGEVTFLSKRFQSVTIFPAKYENEDNKRDLPSNVTCHRPLQGQINKHSIWMNLEVFLNFYFKELFIERRKLLVLRSFRRYLSLFISSINKIYFLVELGWPLKGSNQIYYSYWMNEWALSLSILKYKMKIRQFFIRVHGYDLYDFRNHLNLIPFKITNISCATRVFTISRHGYDYLKEKNLDNGNVQVQYLGVSDYGTNEIEDDSEFCVVSCSSVIPLKRVQLIAKSLKHITLKLRWVHFGDGPGLDHIKNVVKDEAENAKVELRGHVSTQEIRNFFINNPVHLFVNVSETEGLPVSIIESISFGVPVLATNVGGTKEIVTDRTGILLDRETDELEIANEINNFLKSKKNSKSFRKGVKNFWENHFHADKNYMALYRALNMK